MVFQHRHKIATVQHQELAVGHRDRVGGAFATVEYREMLKLLERRGWKKLPAQTPLEFAVSIPDAQIAAPVAQLTELYQSSRFGAHPASASRMESLLAGMKQLLRARPPASSA